MDYRKSKPLFDEVMAFIKACRENNPIKRERDYSDMGAKDIATGTIEEYLLYRYEQFERFDSLALVKAIRDEPAVQKSISLVFKKTTTIDREKLINFIESADISPRTRATRAEHLLPSDRWMAGLIILLNRYLFTDYDAIGRAEKNWEKYERAIFKNIDLLSPVLEKSRSERHKPDKLKQNIANSIYDAISLSYRPDVDTTNDAINRGAARICRKGEKRPEQDFVRGMYYENKIYSRGAKPEAIAELMTLPCFNHCYDARHIARICSKQNKIEEERYQAMLERMEEFRQRQLKMEEEKCKNMTS